MCIIYLPFHAKEFKYKVMENLCNKEKIGIRRMKEIAIIRHVLDPTINPQMILRQRTCETSQRNYENASRKNKLKCLIVIFYQIKNEQDKLLKDKTCKLKMRLARIS